VDLKNNMHIIQYKKIYIGISLVLIVASLISIVFFGLKLGIDFTGGTAVELAYTPERPEAIVLSDALTENGFGASLVQPVGENNLSAQRTRSTKTSHGCNTRKYV
jgi:preprotein translocase subunit SecF